MITRLQDEIKQGVPFDNAKTELWLNLARTTAMVGHGLEQKLRPYGLSPTQYNVLRILRGAGPGGLCQYEIGDRLVAQVPDVPRVIDRMEKGGWVTRTRGVADRRMVIVVTTEDGLTLLTELDGPMREWIEASFTELSQADLRRLNELLVMARQSAPDNGKE